MSGSLIQFPVGTVGVDCSASVAANIQGIVEQGYKFVIRTVALPGYKEGIVSKAEVTQLHDAGLAIGLYQMLSKHPWSAAAGKSDGAAAAAEARALGAPEGLNLWVDLEDPIDGSSSEVVDYLNSWAAAVTAAGYKPSLYNGPQAVVDGATLSNLPGYAAYWQAGAAVPSLSSYRGYQMMQLRPPTALSGEQFDVDVLQGDFRGGYAQFWAG